MAQMMRIHAFVNIAVHLGDQIAKKKQFFEGVNRRFPDKRAK